MKAAKQSLSKILMIAIMAIPGMVFAQNSSAKADSLLLQAINNNVAMGVSAGISVDGKMQYKKGFGYANEENKTAFTSETKTRIASISKPITAVCIMQLVENDKLNLETTIGTYINAYNTGSKAKITIEQLLNHSSGIAAYKNKKEVENTTEYSDLESAIDIFSDRELLFEPGSDFFYSTYNYVVLGRIIELISGTTYTDYVQKNIFDVLKMTNSGIEKFGLKYSNKSQLYDNNGKGKIKIKDPTNLSDRIPGGGIYSTINDMLKFGDALLNNTLISASTFEKMQVNSGLKKEGNAYAFGWYLYGKNPNYGNVIGHTGTQTGASTFLMLLPEVNTTIIVMANTSGAIQSVSNICIQLFDVAAKIDK